MAEQSDQATIRDVALHARASTATVSGWQAEDRLKSQQAGFDHHLVKPVDYTVLTELLAGIGSEGEVSSTTPA